MQTVDALQLWEQSCDGVIVRSSATIEDGSAHSFAGIFESVPISTPEEFEPTVRQIWASVFSPRALIYFREIGVQEVPAMAVVVQRFLRAARSGVMFTRFAGPDGRQCILVEHVEGDCEKLVKGEVTPDRLWLNEAAPPTPPVRPPSLNTLRNYVQGSMALTGGPVLAAGDARLAPSECCTLSLLCQTSPFSCPVPCGEPLR